VSGSGSNHRERDNPSFIEGSRLVAAFQVVGNCLADPSWQWFLHLRISLADRARHSSEKHISRAGSNDIAYVCSTAKLAGNPDGLRLHNGSIVATIDDKRAWRRNRLAGVSGP